MLKLMSFSTRLPAVRGFCTFMRALTSAEQRFVNQAFLALDDNGDGVLQMEEGAARDLRRGGGGGIYSPLLVRSL